MHTHSEGGPGHTHGAVDPSIVTTKRGIWAVKWSFAVLMVTAVLQVAVVWFTGSVALLADTIHNFGDASTAIPLWIAFRFAQLKPNLRFTHGHGRVEDFAGLFIVIIILLSALVTGHQAVSRLTNPRDVEFVWAVAGAGVVGFIGNEAVALFRMRVGKQIHSAALIADGYHARADGLSSLAVAGGAVGIWIGYGIADPIVALVITAMILRIVWQSSSLVFGRLLDRIDPSILEEITHATHHVQGVVAVNDQRARWSGHRMHVQLSISVASNLTVVQGHQIAQDVRHQIVHHLEYISSVTVHVDPISASGNRYHAVVEHQHDGLPTHSHGE
jgi:cation diffusion facilitator family transporter